MTVTRDSGENHVEAIHRRTTLALHKAAANRRCVGWVFCVYQDLGLVVHLPAADQPWPCFAAAVPTLQQLSDFCSP